MTLLKRELIIRFRNPSQWLYSLVFFLMVIVLFPLAIGAVPEFLHRMAVPIVWVAVLLAMLLGVDGLFMRDVEDGWLEQLIIQHISLPIWVITKVSVQWLGTGFVLVLLSWLSIPLFGLSVSDTFILSMTIAVGSPMLSLMTGLAAALTVSLRGNSLLVPLIAIPLQIPVLIFAAGTVSIAQTGGNPWPTIAILAAMSLLGMLLLPFVIATALKQAL